MTDTPQTNSIPFAGLWRRKRKDGSEFLMGNLPSGARLILVKNEHREAGPKSPHYWLKLLPPVPRDQDKKSDTAIGNKAAWKGGSSPKPEFDPNDHPGMADRSHSDFETPEEEVPF